MTPSRALTSPLIVLALSALGGCHLFADGSIPCTQDELPECAEGDADTDADADTDTDTDTDSDSDTDLVPIMGLAMVGSTPKDGTSWVAAWDASAEEVLAWEGLSVALEGPTAYDPEVQRFWVSEGDMLYALEPSGTLHTFGPLGDDVRDIELLDSVAYVAAGDGLYAAKVDVGLARLTEAGALVNVDSVFQSGSNAVYLIDLGASGQGPSLYSWDTGRDVLSLEYAAYDATVARSVDGFLGPDLAPFVCSKGGGAYAIEEIFNTAPDGSGNKSVLPERLASGSPTDIVDCGYDPGSDEILFVSQSRGALRVSASGVTGVWLAPATGDEVHRGQLFAP